MHSKRFYSFGVEKFERFCKEEGLDVSQDNVYSVLDSFVTWLDKKGLKAKTIVDYMSAVRRFLAYLGINMEPGAFKNKVVMPRVTKIADAPLRVEDVRTILTKGRPSPKLRTIILTLLSSGMRIGEALSLKVGDLNLETSPGTVTIRAKYAKTKVGRTAYVSDEAKEALKIITKDAAKDRLVFDYSGDLWAREKSAIRTFREIVDRAGLGEMIESHRIHKIHFHSFRKFFLTKAVDILGDHAGHALCGHGFYMDTYYKKSEDERRQDYLKLMPHLSVSSQAEKVDIRTELAKQLMLIAGFKNEEVNSMNVSEISDEDIQMKIRQRLLGAMANNGNRQRVI